ncbi:MAG TPA: endonuclease domain-containing protein [Novosphingobium sp.]
MITGPRDTLKRARKLRSEMTLPEGLKFRRQHPAGVYILDFYCAAARLAIEVDGWAHDIAEQAKRDAAQSHFLRSQGVATLRVPAKAVLDDMPRAVARIVEVCLARVPLHHAGAEL